MGALCSQPLPEGEFLAELAADAETRAALVAVGLDDAAIASLRQFFVAAQRDTARARRRRGEEPPYFADALPLDALFAHAGIARSAFGDRVFSLLAEGGGEAVSFRAFALQLFNFLALDRAALAHFAFALLDPGATGFVDEDDLGALLCEVHGGSDWRVNPRLAAVVREAMAMAAKAGDAAPRARAGAAKPRAGPVVGLETFRRVNDKFPMLLFPAFSMQRALRSAVLGDAFWARQYARREAAARARAQKGGERKEEDAFSMWDVLKELGRSQADSTDAREVRRLRGQRYVPAHLLEGGDAGGAAGAAGAGGAASPADAAPPAAAATGAQAKELAALRRRELNAGRLRDAEQLREAGEAGEEARLVETAAEIEARLAAARERRGARGDERRAAWGGNEGGRGDR
jgi:hypothetical protein